jgi:hypothetical protein
MADLTTLQTRLTEAETALHQLMTGSKAEQIGSDRSSVRYTAAQIPALERYISTLKSQIARAGGSGSRRRAFVVDL